MHATTNYGTASLKHGPLVAQIVNKLEISHLLDYGCGKQMNLAKVLSGKAPTLKHYQAYEPAIPELAEAPVPAQMVACIDVLEHIEPELIDNVIRELGRITTNLGFFSIHMGPAGKTLADGRNAHLIQMPSSWWLKKLTDYFEILHLQSHQVMGRGIWMIVTHKQDLK